MLVAPAVLAACATSNGDNAATAIDAAALAAQTASLPDADIFAAAIKRADNGLISLGGVRNLTSAPGYQNQPHPVGGNDPAFYFVAEGTSGKTDLWMFDLRDGVQRQLTDTPDVSEYSPKTSPGGGLAYIQESPDGEVTRVHLAPKPGAAGAAVIDLAPLGYYEWLASGARLAVFYRSEPPTLALVDVADGVRRDIFDNVGRAFQASPDGAALFVTRTDEAGRHNLMRVNADSGAYEALFALPGASGDFWIEFADGAPARIWSPRGAAIFYRTFDENDAWRTAGEFAADGLGSISRMILMETNSTGYDDRAETLVFVAEKPTTE